VYPIINQLMKEHLITLMRFDGKFSVLKKKAKSNIFIGVIKNKNYLM